MQRWYLPRTVKVRGKAASAVALGAAAVAIASGCGESQQNAAEKQTQYRVDVVAASFPRRQYVARQEKLVITIRNAGSETVPSPAISIRSFSYHSSFPELADPLRPVWVVEKGPGPGASQPPVSTQEVSQPGGAQTAYVSTWTLGPLKSGAQQTYTWEVVPVKPGIWAVTYEVAAGLGGNAKAISASGGPVSGRLAVHIARKPPLTHVNPRTGLVEEGTLPPRG